MMLLTVVTTDHHREMTLTLALLPHQPGVLRSREVKLVVMGLPVTLVEACSAVVETK
jgi:hypothetical protein